MVDHLKKRNIHVILGGVGFSFIPNAILEYLRADWGVIGPGEQAIEHILDLCEHDPPSPGTVFDGWEMGFDPDIHILRGESIDYERYIVDGGLSGFHTQMGCYEMCSYCSEGRGMVTFRNPVRVAEELHTLTACGFSEFHLCDTEFNQDLSFCRTFLETLIAEGPEIRWTLYMKTSPYDDELFRLLKKSGAYLITLSVPTGINSLDHAENIIRLVKKYDMQIAVDYLCGFPGESEESVRKTIDRFRDIRPDTVGVNSTLRIYPDLAVTRKIMESPRYYEHIFGAVDNNPDFVRPVFYSHIPVETLRDIIGDDPLFKIEGFERTSNYERLKNV